jgi:hypothetical protein
LQASPAELASPDQGGCLPAEPALVGRAQEPSHTRNVKVGDYSVFSANFLSDFCVDDSSYILYTLNLGLVGNMLAATCHTNHSAAENMGLLNTYMLFLPLALPAATDLYTFPTTCCCIFVVWLTVVPFPIVALIHYCFLSEDAL